ncbi:MAG: hypothetical protein AAF787_05485 [Chloroflexota bacterium]
MQHAGKETITYIVTQRDVEIDASLPAWARRSNPVVRRELGIFWKRLLPDLNLISKLLATQAILLLLVPVTVLMTLTLPVAMLAVVMMPVLLFIYGRVLISVVNNAATSITSANLNYTMDLLRVTPIPFSQVILGKIAASVWHRMEDIDLVVLGLSFFSLPFLTIHYLDSATLTTAPYAMRIVTLAALVSLPLRALLEPFMFSALAVALGSALPTRAVTVVSTLSFMIFYYLTLFVPLAAPLSIGVRVLLEIILPLALPLILTFAAVAFTIHYIQRQ